MVFGKYPTDEVGSSWTKQLLRWTSYAARPNLLRHRHAVACLTDHHDVLYRYTLHLIIAYSVSSRLGELIQKPDHFQLWLHAHVFLASSLMRKLGNSLDQTMLIVFAYTLLQTIGIATRTPQAVEPCTLTSRHGIAHIMDACYHHSETQREWPRARLSKITAGLFIYTSYRSGRRWLKYTPTPVVTLQSLHSRELSWQQRLRLSPECKHAVLKVIDQITKS